MQMLVVFTGKTFGLQVVELSKPFIVRRIKVFLELCTLKSLAKSTANLSASIVTAPIKLVSTTVHAAADMLHPGEQEAGCVPCCASYNLLRALICEAFHDVCCVEYWLLSSVSPCIIPRLQ